MGETHKLIHAIHTLQPEPRWHWTLEGAIANSADAVFAPSQAILDRIAQFGAFQRGVVIPNGIDVAHFANASPVEIPNLKPATFPLGYIGRFDPVKRLDLLIAAVGELRKRSLPVEAFLVGYGEQRSELEQLATSLQVAPFIHFLPPTDNPAGCYKSFALHVLPSPVEGFGLTLVESLAAGTPVVAIHTPVTAQIVRNAVDGILVPSPTVESLVAGIQEVIFWRSQGRWHPDPSQLWVKQRFSLQSMITAHIKNLEKILRD
jgi:glycosyltransferase involved in cell wall biosynthesis